MSYCNRNQFKVVTGVSFVPCCVVAAEDTDVNSRSPHIVHGASWESHTCVSCVAWLMDAKYCGDSSWVLKYLWLRADCRESQSYGERTQSLLWRYLGGLLCGENEYIGTGQWVHMGGFDSGVSGWPDYEGLGWGSYWQNLDLGELLTEKT